MVELLRPPLSVLWQLDAAHELPLQKVGLESHMHCRHWFWIFGEGFQVASQNSQDCITSTLYVAGVLLSRAKLPTRRVVSEQFCHVSSAISPWRLEWSTGAKVKYIVRSNKTHYRTWRRSSKSRAASFFIEETLLLNLRMVSRPKGEISRNLIMSCKDNFK